MLLHEIYLVWGLVDSFLWSIWSRSDGGTGGGGSEGSSIMLYILLAFVAYLLIFGIPAFRGGH